MSYFRRAENVIADRALEFGKIVLGQINIFRCKSGELAAWKLLYVDDVLTSEIYDASSGEYVLKGAVSVLDLCDLTGGLFSSGCFPDRNPLDESCRFYLVDYV